MLEGDGTGQNPAIQFRQDHMHGKIRRVEAAHVIGPGIAPRGCHDDLEHRHAKPVEQAFAMLICLAGKGRCRDDGHRLQRRQRVFQKPYRLTILQATDENRQRGKATVLQGLEQRIDGRGIGCQKHGTVKENGQPWSFGRKRGERLSKIDHAKAWDIEA